MQEGEACEALVHGKWYHAFVVRAGVRDFDIELDDGTELEQVDPSRLRISKRVPKASTVWLCIEQWALDTHRRNGNIGRVPSLKAATSRDEIRKLEQLIPCKELKRMRDTFEKFDAVRAGTLDTEETLLAFHALGRLASKADVLDFLKKERSKHRTFNFLQFCKAYASLFYQPDPPWANTLAIGTTAAMNQDIPTDEVSQWAKALGRPRLLKMETLFRKRCIPFQDKQRTHLGLPVSQVRFLLRDLGHDATATRLETIIRTVADEQASCLTFSQFVHVFHTCFIRDQEHLPPYLETQKSTGLKPIAEIAALIFAEERWDGTAAQHSSLVRRLSAGRLPQVQKLIYRLRDEFESRCLSDDQSNLLSGDAAFALIDALGLVVGKHDALRTSALQLFKDTHKKRISHQDAKSKREHNIFSLAEIFCVAGHLIQAVAESGPLSIPSAFARLRLRSTPHQVREAGELAARYISNVLADPRDPRRWRVAAENAIYQTKIGARDGGRELMHAIGFQTKLLGGGSTKNSKKQYLVLFHHLTGENTLTKSEINILKARLQEIESELAAHDGAPSVIAAIRKIKQSKPTLETLKAALDLARTCITNILKNPTNPKVYRIRRNNTLINSKLLCLDGGLDLMEAIGFSIDHDHFQLRQTPLLDRTEPSFHFPRLTKETEAFLYRIVADLDKAAAAEDTSPQPKTVLALTRTITKKKTKPPATCDLEKLLRSGTRIQQVQLSMTHAAFAAYDNDKDGILSRDDLKTTFSKLGQKRTDAALDEWIARHDLDRDGVVSFSDFLSAVAPMFPPTQDQAKTQSSTLRTSAVAAAIGTLRLGASLPEVKTVVNIVLDKLTKIIQAPANSQLWRIPLQDDEFQRTVAQYPGGVDLFVAAGFLLEENGSVLALRDGTGERWTHVPSTVLDRVHSIRDEIQGRLTAIDHPDIADVQALTSAAALGRNRKTLRSAGPLCLDYLKRIMTHPTNLKVRTISSSDVGFKERILKVPGGLELLIATGFREAQNGGAFTMPAHVPIEHIRARAFELETSLPYLTCDSTRKKEKSRLASTIPSSLRKSTIQKKEGGKEEEIPKSKVNPEDDRRLRLTRTLLKDAQQAKAKAEAEARNAKMIAMSLAAELDDVKKSTKEAHVKSLKSTRPPMRFSGGKDNDPFPLIVGKEVTKVKCHISKPTAPGDGAIQIPQSVKILPSNNESSRWRISYKVRLSSGAGAEERFIVNVESGRLTINRPLDLEHPVGTTAVMIKPSTDERRRFHRIQSRWFIKSCILGPIVDTAVDIAEAVVQSRFQNECYKQRLVPKSLVTAHHVWSRTHESSTSTTMIGALPRFGNIFLREELESGASRLLQFSEGYTLSDARRVFDRMNRSGTGLVVPAEISTAYDEDTEIKMMLSGAVSAVGGPELLPAMRFHEDFVPRFIYPDPTVNMKDLTNSYTEPCKLSTEDICEITMVYERSCGHRGLLWTTSLPAVFAELEGVHINVEDHPLIAEAMKDFEALSLRDLIKLRERHVLRLAAPIDTGTGSIIGAGINGWRRHAMLAIRPIYNATVVQAAKTSGLYTDAAPGYELYRHLCESKLVEQFLLLQVRPQATLRDELHNFVMSSNPEEEQGASLTWYDIEAIVYNRVYQSVPKQNEVFKAPPAVLVDRFQGLAWGSQVNEREFPRTTVVHEVVIDEVRARIFVLTNSGTFEAWDAIAQQICDPTPLLLIIPETTPQIPNGVIPVLSEALEASYKSSELVEYMLALKPRCQILSFAPSARLLLVNTTLGDGCVRIHEVETFSLISKVRLDLPPLRDFGGFIFDIATHESLEEVRSSVKNSRKSCHGGVQKFEFMSNAELIITAHAGTSVLRVYSTSSGALLAYLPGHLGPVTQLKYVAEEDFIVTAATDAQVRLWDLTRSLAPLLENSQRGAIPIGLRTAQSILRTALNEIRLQPSWRNGTVLSVIKPPPSEGVTSNLEQVLVEIEYCDDKAIEVVDTSKLHEPRAPHSRIQVGRLVKLANERGCSGAQSFNAISVDATSVSVWHTRERQSVKKLFAAFYTVETDRVEHGEFMRVFFEIRDRFGTDIEIKSIQVNEVKALVRALDVNDSGFIRYHDFETFILSTNTNYGQSVFSSRLVPAMSILRGHSAAVNSLAFLPHSRLLASSAVDGSIRICDPRSTHHFFCANPLALPHVRRMPGYYTEPPVEWKCAAPSELTLKITDMFSHLPDSAKVVVTALYPLTLCDRYVRSNIEIPSAASTEARRLETDSESMQSRGFLYLFDDGSVRAVETSAFHEKFIALAIEDQGFFSTAAPSDAVTLRSVFADRHRVVRVAYLTSSAYPKFKLMASALETHRQDEIHPLAEPGGGPLSLYKSLEIEHIVFVCRGDKLETRASVSEEDRSSHCDESVLPRCEMLFADVRFTTAGNKENFAIIAWALRRADMRSTLINCNEAVQSKTGEEAFELKKEALDSWRFALHAIRANVVLERHGAAGAAAVARDMMNELVANTSHLLLHKKDEVYQTKVRNSFKNTLALPEFHIESNLYSLYCLRQAFQSIRKWTGSNSASSDEMFDELRRITKASFTDVRQLCLDNLTSVVTRINFSQARRLLEENLSTIVSGRELFLVQRRLALTSYSVWLDLINTYGLDVSSLQTIGWDRLTNIDFLSYALAVDLPTRVERSCRTISNHVQNCSSGETTAWFGKWAELKKCSSWLDRLLISANETSAAVHPVCCKTAVILDQVSRDHIYDKPSNASISSLVPTPAVFTLPSESYYIVDMDCAQSLSRFSTEFATAYSGNVRILSAKNAVNSPASHVTHRALFFQLRSGNFSEESILRRLAEVTASPEIIAGDRVLPGLMTTFDCSKYGPYWLAFQGTEEATLREVMDHHGSLGKELANVVRFWISELCAGLDHFHKNGILFRTLCPEQVLVCNGGQRLKLMPLLIGELNDNYVSRGPVLELEPTAPRTPPEAVRIATNDGWSFRLETRDPILNTQQDFGMLDATSFGIDDRRGASHAWDSWGLGMVVTELLFKTLPLSWASQFAVYVERLVNARHGTVFDSTCDATLLKDAAEAFRFYPFPRDADTVSDYKCPMAGTHLKALTYAALSAIFKRDPLAISDDVTWDTVSTRVQANVRVLAAYWSLQQSRQIASDFFITRVQESLGKMPLTGEGLHQVLVHDLHFNLNIAETNLLAQDWSLLEALLTVATSQDVMIGVFEGSLACVAALLAPKPKDRVLATQLLNGPFLQFTREAAARARLDAESYLRGGTKAPDWFSERVFEPLTPLEASLESECEAELFGSSTNSTATSIDAFVRVVDSCTRALREDWLQEDADQILLSSCSSRLVERMVVDLKIPERCVEFSIKFQELAKADDVCENEENTTTIGGRVLLRVAIMIKACLELSLRDERRDFLMKESLLRVATRFITADIRLPQGFGVEEELLATYAEVAPEHLATLASAVRSLCRSSSGSMGRRGAARAIASLCTQLDAADSLVKADAASLLLPLASDSISSDVRTFALQCCRNAVMLGYKKNADTAPSEPTVLLALAFSTLPWVAVLVRVIRSKASRPEMDTAYEALRVMAASGDLGTRAFAGGHVIAALVHITQSQGVSAMGKTAQDTAEAGGKRNRLLEPFSTTDDDGASVRNARAVLDEILVASPTTAIKSLLMKAFPHAIPSNTLLRLRETHF